MVGWPDAEEFGRSTALYVPRLNNSPRCLACPAVIFGCFLGRCPFRCGTPVISLRVLILVTTAGSETRVGLWICFPTACNIAGRQSVGKDVDLHRELTVSSVDTSVAPTAPDRGSGVDASFDAWVAGASPVLLRFAAITTRDLDPADLVQDALVAVYLRWPRWKDPGQADAYARRVILNGHVSRWRRWGRRVTMVDPALLTEDPAPDGAASADLLTARQLLAALPVPQRAAAFLRFYDDLTYREIAEVVNCREATARSHVHRALIALKNQLEEGTLP